MPLLYFTGAILRDALKIEIFAIRRLEDGLKVRWPKKLSVQRLSIIGWLNPSDIDNLSSIESELNLELNCVGAEQIYQLLEHIGRLVKCLTIGDIFQVRKIIVYDNSDIILERILAACPNLERFQFLTSRSVIQDIRFNMPPAAFKNYQM
jgi:hypothetical protein